MPAVAKSEPESMILEVRIKAPPGGTNRTLRFTKSPIRIGRNQLNDISLDDPFVSEWHGTIRFDQGSVAYFDLGSTNGTELDGKRLAKNVPMELSEASHLRLGLLEFSVVRPAPEPETAPPPRRPHPSGMSQTLAWGQAAAPIDPSTKQPPVNIAGVASASPRTGGVVPAVPLPGALTPPPETAARPAANMELRYQKLLEAFAESFIGLRKGYEQFGREVGVRTINGATPLHRAQSSDELRKYLLRADTDAAATARELIAIFADFGIHHIAMMQGVTEGVRAMLATLSPEANDLDAASRLFGGAKAKAQWKGYVERFEQMITDDNVLHAAIFGNEFARAYASVTIGVGSKPPKQDPE